MRFYARVWPQSGMGSRTLAPEFGRWEVALEYEPSFSASQQQEG